MGYLDIRTYPDPVLRKNAETITNVTNQHIILVDDMLETMYLARGLGLAANQVGVSIRLIIIDPMVKGEKNPIIVFNPEIVSTEGEETGEEGCLSVPGFYEFVKRAKTVHVKGISIDEKPFEMTCEGRIARAFQHEIDHLNGTLFIDYLSPVKRSYFKKKYAKSGK